jgi:hypothetical protein
MFKLKIYGAVLTCAIISTTEIPSLAQVRHPRTEYFSACLDEARSNGDVVEENGEITSRCYGATAERWFNYLGDGHEGSTNNRYGFWFFRNIPGGSCVYHVKDYAGNAVNQYKCAIDQPSP